MGACQSSSSAGATVSTEAAKPMPSNRGRPTTGRNKRANGDGVVEGGSVNGTVATSYNDVMPGRTTSHDDEDDDDDNGEKKRDFSSPHSAPEAFQQSGSAGAKMKRPSSRVGLDTMVEERRTQGDVVSNVVHIESKNTTRKIQDVYDGIEDGAVLGEGVAGLVRTVMHRGTGLLYAVKVLNLDRLLARRSDSDSSDDAAKTRDSEDYIARQQEALRNEISIMSQLDHPHIARLQEVYEDDHNIYLVQEVCSGGELFDLLEDQPDYSFTESEALRLVWQMLSALRYLHSKGIEHRDLKLENFLFSTKEHLQLKMIDFGLSKHFQHPGEAQHDMVGTPYTVAPEIIRGNYDEKCDLWALGVMTYIMLCGETPFGGCGGPESLREVRQNILSGEYSFDKPDASIWESVSDEAKDFIRTLLVTDPNQRPNAEEAQKHRWIRSYHKDSFDPSTTVVNPKLVQALVDFKELPITKRLMFEVVSFALMQDQIAHVQEEFEKLDTEGLGELSLDNLREVLSRRDMEEDNGNNPKRRHRKSLSSLEVESFFGQIKSGKSKSRVHWHEFIAACLPTCRVDDRNLRIAFDRLDQDHNGFITFDEVVQMIARDADEDEDALRQAWKDSVEEYGCDQSHFSFDDFCRFIHSYA